MRRSIKILAGLLFIPVVTIGLVSINHPIILKWLSGTARHIGKPVTATIYTNGQVNHRVKVFHLDKYWSSKAKADNYLVSLAEYDSAGMLKYFYIDRQSKWIGSPVGMSDKDYDCIAGHLFQSETGGHYAPFQDDMKGFNFDPQLTITRNQIRFLLPPNVLKIDSVRIELR